VVAHTESSITFSITDPDGMEGFPGEVVSFVTYSVSNMTLDYKMVGIATTKKTPIMLSSHTYWNLDGFQNPDTALVLNHTLSLPFSGQRIGVDSILIPDGSIVPNQQGSVNDFWSQPKQIGANFTNPDLLGNCGEGCTGYDTAFLVTRQAPFDWRETGPVAVLSSAWSGIQVSVYSDQEAYQIYSCGGQNGSLTLKTTQGLFDNPDRPRTVQQYGCVVMEVEDWIDGINQPEWGRAEKQIYGPDTDPYVLQASLKFSLLGQDESSVAGNGDGESEGLAGGVGGIVDTASSASGSVGTTTSVATTTTVANAVSEVLTSSSSASSTSGDDSGSSTTTSSGVVMQTTSTGFQKTGSAVITLAVVFAGLLFVV